VILELEGTISPVVIIPRLLVTHDYQANNNDNNRSNNKELDGGHMASGGK
jgi:hypothetical protein